MWPFLFTSALFHVTILGPTNQIHMHSMASICNITSRKVSFLTKSMMLNNFVIGFFFRTSYCFWDKKANSKCIRQVVLHVFFCVAHNNFTIPRPHFYDYSSCRWEIIWMVTNFSGQPVYLFIYLAQIFNRSWNNFHSCTQVQIHFNKTCNWWDVMLILFFQTLIH